MASSRPSGLCPTKTHPIRMSLDQHRHKKQLGQHFLHERGIIDRILLALAPKPGQRIVEIGPGGGALTFPLLRQHGELTVIEFDRDLVGPLAEAAAGIGRLHIVQADVLTVDLAALAAGDRLRLERAQAMPLENAARQAADLVEGHDDFAHGDVLARRW